MVYFFCKSAMCFPQTAKAKTVVFHIVFFIWMTSSGIHICTLKQHSMSTCRQNKHTQTPSGSWKCYLKLWEFSLPQIEYPLGGSSKKGSHVYFLLIVAIVLLLWHQILLLWHQVTMVVSEQHLYQRIVLPRKHATGSIHDYLFCYYPLVGILFEVLRIIHCKHWKTIWIQINTVWWGL